MRVKVPFTGAPLQYSSTQGSILLRNYYRNKFNISIDASFNSLSQVTSYSYNIYGLRKYGTTTWQFQIPGPGSIYEVYNDTPDIATIGSCGFNVIYSSLQIDCNLIYIGSLPLNPGVVRYLEGYVPFPQRPDYRVLRDIMTLTPQNVIGPGINKLGNARDPIP